MEEENKRYDYVEDVEISKEMRTAFLDYSMSVIVSRALPDVRDGMKTCSSSYFTCNESIRNYFRCCT